MIQIFLKHISVSQELVHTTLVKQLRITATQHGSKYYNLFLLTLISFFNRFGSSIRKDTKRMNVPGPGTHEIKSHTDSGVKYSLQKRLTEAELKEFRANIYKKDDGLGPGQYNA
jgi:hypothetical protein